VRRAQALGEAAARLAAAGCPEARADAEVLLAHVLGVRRAQLFIDRDAPLEETSQARFDRLLARRLAREPTAYVTGLREFWSLPFRVTRAVLIPRPETETLVEEALARVDCLAAERGPDRSVRVVDVGTGSGCVAVALARERARVSVLAIDRSARALAVARQNAEINGVADRVILARGDLLAGVSGADLVVSNPPYVTQSEWKALPPEIRDFEPASALRGGKDGLAFYRRLAREAPGALKAGGFLALEVGAGQAAAVCGLVGSGGHFAALHVRKDLSGIPRVVSARRV